jgi:hypothetical protein
MSENDSRRDPKTDPVIPAAERELNIQETGTQPDTTQEHEDDNEPTQDEEVNQNIANDS